jgi:SAM-dependent methyltransferase
MSDYKQFWEARNKTEMYLKVVGADHEDPDDVALTVQLFTKGIPWCGTALEIGSGYGRLVKAMAPYFDNVCGIDISHSLLTRAAEYLKDVPNGWSFKTDGQSLPLGPDTIDYVYSCICFQHMPTLEIIRKNIAEIFRVLKPGGRCRIQTIQGEPVDIDSCDGRGRLFASHEDFLSEFLAVGFEGTSQIGLKHPLAIWVDARKPEA